MHAYNAVVPRTLAVAVGDHGKVGLIMYSPMLCGAAFSLNRPHSSVGRGKRGWHHIMAGLEY
jgi:hypothetical protein